MSNYSPLRLEQIEETLDDLWRDGKGGPSATRARAEVIANRKRKAP